MRLMGICGHDIRFCTCGQQKSKIEKPIVDPKHVMEATSAFYESCALFEAGHPGWPGTVHMGAAMSRLIELGWKAPHEHDARVTELLEANNREVELRRQAERDRHAGCFCPACNPATNDDETDDLFKGGRPL